MLNELIFLGHITTVILLDILAAFLGKEFLIAAIVTQGLLANFFILKQVSMFGLIVTGTDAFIIGMVLAVNLLEEIYGRETSSRAINCYFFALTSTFIFTYLHLHYNPAIYDNTNGYYLFLLNQNGRIITATLLVSFLSLHLDRYLYRLLSKTMDVRFLSIKNFITTAASQLFDTILFSYLALFGIFSNMWDLIIFSYSIKIISLALTTIILFFMRNQITSLKTKGF